MRAGQFDTDIGIFGPHDLVQRARFGDDGIGCHHIIAWRAQGHHDGGGAFVMRHEATGQKRFVQHRVFNIGDFIGRNIGRVFQQRTHFQIILANGAGVLEIGDAVDTGRIGDLPTGIGQLPSQVQRVRRSGGTAVFRLIDINNRIGARISAFQLFKRRQIRVFIGKEIAVIIGKAQVLRAKKRREPHKQGQKNNKKRAFRDEFAILLHGRHNILLANLGLNIGA